MEPLQSRCPCDSGRVYDACCGPAHEVSRFEQRAGRWVYVDGDQVR